MSLSRREFLVRSSAAVALTSFAQTAIARAMQQSQQQPPPAGAAPQAPQWTPAFTDIRRNVGFYTGRGGTIGYLIDKGAVVVVDSQFPDSAKACLDGLQERSKNHGVDLLINTHHHGDHTGGNIAFKGVAKRVLAHERAVELQKQVASQPPRAGGPPPPEQLYADRTLSTAWREQLGDEWITCKFYGRAHTSGDITIAFERANVVHMGDLMFNRRHPVVDRPAGALMRNHISVLEAVVKEHNNDTIYIFGHSGNPPAPATGPFPVTGPRAELMYFRDYLTALLGFVQGEIKAGKTRDDIIAIATPLPKFETHGNLNRTILGAAYDELTTT
jgi:glyoxylase-like metal-dependent hydrolase (beta-lactamase superfamily II)